MANIKKYTRDDAANILHHNSRLPDNYKNPDVDTSRSHLNVTFFDKGYAGYKKRLDELYVRNQADVKTLCEWIVTVPEKLTEMNDIHTYRNAYWSTDSGVLKEVSDFLCKKYGEENCIQSIVHFDESGRPHLHFTFIPAAEDPRQHKESGLKVAARDIITKTSLKEFHAELRDYINNAHLDPMFYGSRPGDYFYTGITKAQGGNRTVDQLKQIREMQRTIDHQRSEIAHLQERVQELEREKSVDREWVNMSRWESDREVEHEIEW